MSNSCNIKFSSGLTALRSQEEKANEVIRENMLILAKQLEEILKDAKNEGLSDEARAQLTENRNAIYSAAQDPLIESNIWQLLLLPKAIFITRMACENIIDPIEKIEQAYLLHKGYGPAYVENSVLTKGKILHVVSSVHLIASTFYFVHGIANTLHSLKTDNAVQKFNAIAGLVTHASDWSGDIFEKAQLLKVAGIKIGNLSSSLLGSLATLATFINAATETLTKARGILDDNLSQAEKVAVITQSVIQGSANVAQVAALTHWLDKIDEAAEAAKLSSSHAKTGLSVLSKTAKPLVILGLAADIIGTLFIASDIISIKRIQEYSQQLSKEHERYKNSTFNGLADLSQYYKDKAVIDSISLGLQTTISIVGGITSLLAMTSVIGMPAAIAIGAITAVLSFGISIGSQVALDHMSRVNGKEIDNYHRNNPHDNYFYKALDAYYDGIKDKLTHYATHLLNKFELDQVYLISEIRSSKRIHEIATTLGELGKPAPGGKQYKIGLSKDGAITSTEDPFLFNENSNTITIGGNTKRCLAFATYTSYFGREWRQTYKSSGKPDQTYLHMFYPERFITDPVTGSEKKIITLTISNTGKGDMIVDTNHLTHIHYTQTGTRKALVFEINLGQGNGSVYANAAQIHIKGEANFRNHADYSYTPQNTKLIITADSDAAYQYKAQKKIETVLVVEKIVTDEYQFGRNKKAVERREFVEQKESYTTTDTLNNIHTFTCAPGGTEFYGGKGDESIFLAEGEDDVRMREGNDLTVQSIYEKAHNDKMCGGEGQNALHYATRFIKHNFIQNKETISFNANVHITAAINKNGEGTVAKYRELHEAEEGGHWAGQNGNYYRRKHLGQDSVKHYQYWLIACQGNNDISTAADNYIFKFSGNNNNRLEISGTHTLMLAEHGNNEITTQATSHHNVFSLGDGNNKLTLRGYADTVTVGNGNNHINAHGNHYQFTLGNGHNKLTVIGKENVITLGEGENTVSLRGSLNRINQILSYRKNSITTHSHLGDASYTLVNYNNFVGEIDTDHFGQKLKLEANGIEADLEIGFVKKNFTTVTTQLLDKDYAARQIKNLDPRAQKISDDTWQLQIRDTVRHANAIIGTLAGDKLSGTNTDDLLDGVAGTNHITGRKGNDDLRGGVDNDFYYYHKGDGQDSIRERGGFDTIVLRATETSSFDQKEIVLKKEENNLIIEFKHESNNDDKIVVENQFKSPEKEVEQLRINKIDYSINQLVQAAATLSGNSAASSWSYFMDQLTPITLSPPQ